MLATLYFHEGWEASCRTLKLSKNAECRLTGKIGNWRDGG